MGLDGPVCTTARQSGSLLGVQGEVTLFKEFDAFDELESYSTNVGSLEVSYAESNTVDYSVVNTEPNPAIRDGITKEETTRKLYRSSLVALKRTFSNCPRWKK